MRVTRTDDYIYVELINDREDRSKLYAPDTQITLRVEKTAPNVTNFVQVAAKYATDEELLRQTVWLVAARMAADVL